MPNNHTKTLVGGIRNAASSQTKSMFHMSSTNVLSIHARRAPTPPDETREPPHRPHCTARRRRKSIPLPRIHDGHGRQLSRSGKHAEEHQQNAQRNAEQKSRLATARRLGDPSQGANAKAYTGGRHEIGHGMVLGSRRHSVVGTETGPCQCPCQRPERRDAPAAEEDGYSGLHPRPTVHGPFAAGTTLCEKWLGFRCSSRSNWTRTHSRISTRNLFTATSKCDFTVVPLYRPRPRSRPADYAA